MPLLTANHEEVVALEGEARSDKEMALTDELSSTMRTLSDFVSKNGVRTNLFIILALSNLNVRL